MLTPVTTFNSSGLLLLLLEVRLSHDFMSNKLVSTNPAIVAVPPGVVTLTAPPIAPVRRAVMRVAETIVNGTATPPTLTAVAPVKLRPLMVMVVVVEPLGMVVGVKLVITGAGTGVKVKPAITAVPSGVVTLTSPDKPPTGTTAVMRVAELTTNDDAAMPPKLTLLAPVKLLPEITTLVPGVAVAGVKPVIRGPGGR